MTVDTGLIFFRGDFHLPRRFRFCSRDPSHRSYGGNDGVAELFSFMRAHSRSASSARLASNKFFRGGINRVGDKCLVRSLLASKHVSCMHGISGDMAIVAFRAYAGKRSGNVQTVLYSDTPAAYYGG